MPYRDGTFARCISLLMLNFLPDYRRATAEMVCLAQVGRTVGAAAWDFAGGLPAHRMLRHRRSARTAGGAPERFFQAPAIWMEFSDFARYWAAYAWATDDYLQRLSESASMRLTEPVHAAYLAGAADGPRAFTADSLRRARRALLRPMLRLRILLASAAALVVSVPFAGADKARQDSAGRLRGLVRARVA